MQPPQLAQHTLPGLKPQQQLQPELRQPLQTADQQKNDEQSSSTTNGLPAAAFTLAAALDMGWEGRAAPYPNSSTEPTAGAIQQPTTPTAAQQREVALHSAVTPAGTAMPAQAIETQAPCTPQDMQAQPATSCSGAEPASAAALAAGTAGAVRSEACSSTPGASPGASAAQGCAASGTQQQSALSGVMSDRVTQHTGGAGGSLAGSSTGNAAGDHNTANEDPLGLNLCWAGPGLRQRPARVSSCGSKPTSSSSNRVLAAPQQQQQQQQQPPVLPAEDSWEAVLLCMRQNHQAASRVAPVAAATHATAAPPDGSCDQPAAAAVAGSPMAPAPLADSSTSASSAPAAAPAAQETALAVGPPQPPSQQLPPPAGLIRTTSSSSFRICSADSSTAGSRSSTSRKLDRILSGRSSSSSKSGPADTAPSTGPHLPRFQCAGTSSSKAGMGRQQSSQISTGPAAPHPSSPRGESDAASTPLLRSSSSSLSSASSLQLAALRPPASGGGRGGRGFMGAVRVRPPNRPVGWWVCGGLAVAAVAGGAVAAVYGIMTYFLKMSMVRGRGGAVL